MKQLKSISAHETLELIKKPWASISDIQKLACCGRDKATSIKENIAQDIEVEGYKLPTGKVPMDKLVGYLKINISYLKKVTK